MIMDVGMKAPDEPQSASSSVAAPLPPEEDLHLSQMPKSCSDAQRRALYRKFDPGFMDQQQISVIRRFHTPLMRATRCPSEPWLDRYFSERSNPHFLGMNVGCNKGLDAIAIARLLAQDPTVSPDHWRRALGSSLSRPVCGMPSAPGFLANTTTASGTVHCIEPLPSTVTSLQKSLNTTGYSSHIQVTQAAMSNTSGFAMFPNGNSGEEGNSLASCQQDLKGCAKVPLYTVDEYLEQVGSHDTTPIDILLIDAEGFDYEVLQGSRATLQRVRYLAFEVHITGNWMDHSLVDLLHTTLQDFTCYWSGNNELWRITDCVDPSLKRVYDEFESWSNVACVHHREVELADMMDTVFQQSMQRLGVPGSTAYDTDWAH